MRATKSSIKTGLLCIALFFCISSCKKKRAFNEESAQSTVDNRMAQGENDEALKDVDLAIMEQFLLRGRSAASDTSGTSLCGVVVDTSLILSGIIRLNYDGTLCFGSKRRGGTIQFTIQGYPIKKWKHPGCVVKVDFLGYKVIRSSDGKQIQFDGTQYITNVSGDTWFELWYLNASSLVHTITGNNLKVTYNGASDVAIMNVNRKATYTFSNDVTTCKIEGLGVYNGHSNLENWGQTRDGEEYTCEVITPIIWKTSCGAIAPLSGEVYMQVDDKEYELKCLFGVDKQGDGISGESQCPYGWKVSWSRKNKTNTRIFGYY